MRHQTDPAQTAEGLRTKNARRDAAPYTAQTMQGPYAQHIVNFQMVLRQNKRPYKQTTRHQAGSQGTNGVHQIGAGAHRDQPGQGAIVQKARVESTYGQRRQGAADHRHQRIDRHQTTDTVQGLGRHHVEPEPAYGQDPGAKSEERNIGGRHRNHVAIAITAAARTQHQYRAQGQPAADSMDHNRTGKVMERRPEGSFHPVLQTVIAVPHQTLEERVDQTDNQQRSHQLGRKTGPFGNTTGDDRRNGCGKGHQEEELDQRIAVILRESLRAVEKGDTIGNPVADEKIRNAGDGKVTDNLGKRIDLILLADRAYLQKGETGVHGQDHDRTHEKKHRVCAVHQCFHRAVQVFH